MNSISAHKIWKASLATQRLSSSQLVQKFLDIPSVSHRDYNAMMMHLFDTRKFNLAMKLHDEMKKTNKLLLDENYYQRFLTILVKNNQIVKAEKLLKDEVRDFKKDGSLLMATLMADGYVRAKIYDKAYLLLNMLFKNGCNVPPTTQSRFAEGALIYGEEVKVERLIRRYADKLGGVYYEKVILFRLAFKNFAKVMNLITKVYNSGITLSPLVLNRIVISFIRYKKYDHARRIINIMKISNEKGVEMLELYLSMACGSMEDVNEKFYRLQSVSTEITSRIMNEFIRYYLSNKNFELAENFLESCEKNDVKPDINTYLLFYKDLMLNERVDKAKIYYSKAVSLGLYSNTFVLADLIRFHFNKLNKPIKNTKRKLNYVKNGRPNYIPLNDLLITFSNHNKLKMAKDTLSYILRKTKRPPLVGSLLAFARALVRNNKIKQAYQIINKMRYAKKIATSLMINVLNMENKQLANAFVEAIYDHPNYKSIIRKSAKMKKRKSWMRRKEIRDHRVRELEFGA